MARPKDNQSKSSASRIRLPANKWSPRAYQRPLWTYLETGGKRAVAVWHRRAGKDEVALHWAAVAANAIKGRHPIGRVGNYWHMLPQASQARKAIWEAVNPRTGKRRIDEAFPEASRESTRESDMLIRFQTGSTWQVVGSDNYNSLIGASPIGIVFSEWALADPAAWAYLRPILGENGGWALFIYTPRGRNHGAVLYDMAAREAGWFADLKAAPETGALTADVLEQERHEYRAQFGDDQGQALFDQEYLCSFNAAILGSYYGGLMATAEKEGRVTKVPWEPNRPVITAWDLGVGDATAIWFAQQVGREIRLIDYYEAAGQGLDHYAKVLREKPYVYDEGQGFILPHDADQSELSTARTRLQTLSDLGIRRGRRILPRGSVDDGINAVRVILPRCWFDAEKCTRGIEALRQYRKAWDDERKLFSDRPEHDWTSHPADAFRYLAVGLREPTDPHRKPPPLRANSGYSPMRWRLR